MRDEMRPVTVSNAAPQRGRLCQEEMVMITPDGCKVEQLTDMSAT